MSLSDEHKAQLIQQFREIADRADRLHRLTGLEMYREMFERARARVMELEASKQGVPVPPKNQGDEVERVTDA